MGKTWFMAPMEYNPNGKDIMAPMEYVLMVHSPNGKGIALRKTVFGRHNCHGGKRLKKYSIKDTMSINISFMHYMKWTRVMLPVVFEEFEVFYIFWLLFFTIIVNLQKGQTLETVNLKKVKPLWATASEY